MEKIKINVRDIVSFIIMAMIAIIVIFLGLAFVGNNAETFNDIIIETVAYYGTNETGELSIFWCVLFVGIPILLLVQYLINRKRKSSEQNKQIKTIIGIETVINIANIMLYIVTGSFSPILVCVAILSFLDYIIYPEKEKQGLILSIITYYFLLSIATIYNNRGGTILLNSTILSIATIVINLILLGIEKKKTIINKSILCMQIFIPFLLLLYKCQRYTYQGEIYYVGIPDIARIVILSAIALMGIYAIYQTIKKWKKASELQLKDIILATTCMIVFTVNSVSIDTSLMVPTDLHHTAEEVISYQQIIGKGQGAYVDYSPVSGLFPVLIGAVLEAFGGNITAFNLAHSIFMIIFAMITMYVLTKHLKKEDCLIVGMLFCFPSYDRTVFILLSLLILLLPKLIKNKNLWLKVWIWLCFLGGIYYPSFGGAVLVGTLPFGIIQLIGLIKENEFKEKLKTIRFYLGWILCLIPIILALPMLYNMAKHILVYSAQTNLADGISVFGQTVPESFLPYLANLKHIRVVIYYGTRYMIPIASVWLLVMILVKAMKNSKIKQEIKGERFFALSSAIITLLISYTATIVRCDEGTILSRPTYVIVPIVGILLFLIIKKYVKQNIASYILIGIIAGLALILGNSPVSKLDSKFLYAYSVSDNYEIITEELTQKYPRLGNGFILKKDKEMFEGYYNRANELLKYDENLKFLAWGKLGVYYTLDLTTVGQPSLYAAKDINTHQEIIDAIKEQKPVIGMDLSTSVLNYYLYNWLLITDEYVYDENYEAFLPVKLFEKIYGNATKPTDKREISLYATDVGRVSNSLGKSLDTLKERMEQLDIEVTKNDIGLTKNNVYQYNLNFNKEIDAKSADFMYLEFDIDGEVYDSGQSKLKKIFSKQHPNDGIYVIASWGEEEKESILSILGDGKLLIPLGTNVNWFLNNHKDISLSIRNIDKKINIKNVCFYKLQTERKDG